MKSGFSYSLLKWGKGGSDEKPVHEVKNGYSFTVFRVGAAGVVGFRPPAFI